MKVSVNDVEIYTISTVQEDVIKDYVSSVVFDEDLNRRLFWVLNELYNQSYKQLKNTWEQKLIDRGVTSIPTDKDLFAQLVFSQPDYKDRSTRDAEALAAQQPVGE
jgi:hypothetical protein